MFKRVMLFIFVLLVLLGIGMLSSVTPAVQAIAEVTPTPVPAQSAPQAAPDVDVEQLLSDAIAAIQAGNFQEAIDLANTLLQAEPDNTQAYLVRGVANSQLGHFDESIADLSSAIETAPYSWDIYNFRAGAYTQQGELGEAILDYERAIELNPLNGTAFQNRADLYSQLGDNTAADVDLLIAQALQLFSLGDAENAINFLDEAINTGEQSPTIAVAHYIRAIAHSQSGDNQAALDDYQAALDVNPDMHNVYLARGINYRENGDLVAAGEDFNNRINLLGQEFIDRDLNIGSAIEVEMDYRRVYRIRFEGTTGEIVTISASDTNDTVVDPLIALLDPSGEAIAGDDDFGENLSSKIEAFELPASGTYTLLVSHAEGGFDAGYNGMVRITVNQDVDA